MSISLRFCILLGTIAMVAAFSTQANTASETPAGTETVLVPATKEGKTGSIFQLFSSCRRSREPSIVEKQFRRFTVFSVALKVFLEYKWAQYKAKRLKKRLGLEAEDGDSDDHPEVRALWSQVHKRTSDKLLLNIFDLGGFWVKVGQYLSSRGDVMPPEYLETLSQLQDSMPPRSWADTWQTIQEELDEDALERLEQIDRKPLSTASLAQVHRAVLKEHNGETHQVVLKVQHRGVATLMLQDMENLRFILNLLAKTDPDLDFGPVIREYNQEVRKELDFRTEAENMKEISRLLKDSNITTVIIPDAIPGFVTERCLVMDFCEGFPLRETEKLDEYNVDRELLLERVCAAWAVQMHVGGVFNCDPHMGNLLVSTAPGANSVPVLLDFGLTKRLTPEMKLAFARLMHASHESDVDGLLQSFDEMGLKMNRHDPFQDLANMQRGFGSTVPQSEAREASKLRSQDYKRRMEAQRAEAGLKKGEKLRNPVEAWPSELVFFGRVTAMLRGMCSRLEVNYPYLKTMAVAARETLKESVPLEEHATDFIHPSAKAVNTSLQTRLMEALRELKEEGHVVGLQCCVLRKGEEIAQVAAGTMGTANPRPVTPTTLFNVFSVGKAFIAIGAIHLLQEGQIESLDDPVARYWPAFASKPTVTVRHLLTHQSGLANEYPEDATLDTLLDWVTMKEFMAKHAVPSHEPGTETRYHALSYAWLVGGLIEAVTGRPYEEYLDKIFPCTIAEFSGENPTRRDLFLSGIAEDVDSHKHLAVLSVDMGNEDGSKKTANSPKQSLQHPKVEARANNKSDEDGVDEDERKKEAKKVLMKYRGLQQLLNPSVFNMRKVREAKLPSANGHATATSLARVFDAVIRESRKHSKEPILSKETIQLARTPSRTTLPTTADSNKEEAMLDDAGATFGLGFQLHEFTLANGDKRMSIGHAGLGGSVVLALPDEEVVVALTLNHLSSDSMARKRVLGIIFDQLGWTAPASIGVEAAPTIVNKEVDLVQDRS